MHHTQAWEHSYNLKIVRMSWEWWNLRGFGQGIKGRMEEGGELWQNTGIELETCQSGLSCLFAKEVCPLKGTDGSNPSVSAMIRDNGREPL